MAVGAKFATASSSLITSSAGVDLTLTGFMSVGLVALDTTGDRIAWTLTNGGSGSGNATLVPLFYQPGAGNLLGAYYAPTGVLHTIGQAVTTDVYWLVIVTKAAGTSTARIHIYNGTSWSHTNAGVSGGDVSGTLSHICIGNYGDLAVGSLDGDVAYLSLFQLTGSAPSDGTVETYLDYPTLEAVTNKRFSTGYSLISAGTMADNSGNGNNESSRSGITTGTYTIPSWFTNFPPNVAAVTLADATSSASGSVANPPGVVYVKEVGFVTNTTSGSTSAITVAAGGVDIGDYIVISGSCDNTGTNGVATTIAVADNSNNAGTANTYTLQTPQAIADPSTASSGQQGFFVVCPVTRSLDAGDTITITYGNSTAAKAINAQQWRPSIPGDISVLASSYTREDNQTGQAVSLSATPTMAGQVVHTLVAVEGGTADSFTQDSDTTNGSWVTLTRRGSGTTTSGATLNSAYKIVTASGAQAYGGATMLGTSRDHCGAILVLTPPPITGTVAVTLANAIGAATGAADFNVTGTVAVTLANFTSTASGSTPVIGTSAQTLANFTSTASGTETITGSVAVTLAAATSTASGTVGNSMTGTVAVTLADVTSAASGTETITGSGTPTLAAATSSTVGYVLNWPYVEPFTYADGALDVRIPSVWDQTEGVAEGGALTFAGSLVIVGNELTLASDDVLQGNHSLVTFPWDDQYASMDYDPNSATGLWGVGICVRGSADGRDGYQAWPYRESGGALLLQLLRSDDEIATVLDQVALPDGGPHNVEIRAVGNTISCYLDGVLQMSETDSTYPTQRTFGIVAYAFGADPPGLPSMDNFEAGQAFPVGAVTGDGASTLADFTSSVSGTETFTGSGSPTLANFTSTATGTETISGTVAVTLAAFTSSASGLVGVIGSASPTLADATSTASGTETITGMGSPTLENFTSTASGFADVVGSAAVTLAAFTSAASGTETIAGSGSSTLDNFTAAGTGSTPVTGSVAVTLENFTALAAGEGIISGSSSQTLANLTSVASGSETITGAAAPSTANVTASASGTESFTGSAAVTLADFTSSATGTETISGTVAATLDPFTSAASGLIGATGTAAVTLEPFTAIAAGEGVIAGSVAVVLAAFTSTATGTETISGSGTSTLEDFTSQTTSPSGILGTGASTLGNFTAAATGILIIVGVLAEVLEDFIANGQEDAPVVVDPDAPRVRIVVLVGPLRITATVAAGPVTEELLVLL